MRAFLSNLRIGRVYFYDYTRIKEQLLSAVADVFFHTRRCCQAVLRECQNAISVAFYAPRRGVNIPHERSAVTGGAYRVHFPARISDRRKTCIRSS